MKRLLGVCLGLALSVTTAFAQDVPELPDKTPTTGEKAGADESLQKTSSTGERPWAAGVPADKQKAALAKFRQANELLNQGLFARASEVYKDALTYWAHPAIHYNLALALMNVDQPIEAYDNLEKSIVFGEAPLEHDKFEHAKEYMVLLEKQIAHVEVSCDKVGAKVSVDGKQVFVAPGTYKARVRIGQHSFVAEKQGYNARITAPFVGPGEHFRIALKLYTAEELTRYNRRWQATWMPYAVIGAGVAAGVVGVAFELSASSAYNNYDKAVAACNMNNAGCPTTSDLQSKRDSGDTKKNLGYISYGVAGATVAAGVVLAILNRPQPYQIRPEDLQQEHAARGASVSITPVLSPTLAGAMLQGQF